MFLSKIPELKGEVDILFLEAAGAELEKDGKIGRAIEHYCLANLIYAKNWRVQCMELLDHVRSLRKKQDRKVMEINERIGRFDADWGDRYKEYERTGTMPPRTCGV